MYELIIIPCDVIEQVEKVMAYRSCVRRGPGGHYNSVRCFDQGTSSYGSNEYENEPLAKEKWCDGCAAYVTLKDILDSLKE